jgi:hypothetical protein
MGSALILKDIERPKRKREQNRQVGGQREKA